MSLDYWLNFYPTLKTQAFGWTINAKEIIIAIDPIFVGLEGRTKKILVSILMDAHVFLPHELILFLCPDIGINWIRKFDRIRSKLKSILMKLRHDSFIALVFYTMTQVKQYMMITERSLQPKSFDDLVSFSTNDTVTEKIVGQWLPEYETVIRSDRYRAHDENSISSNEAQWVLLYGPHECSKQVQEAIAIGMVPYLHSLGDYDHCPFDIRYKRKLTRDALISKLNSEKYRWKKAIIKADIIILDQDLTNQLSRQTNEKLCWV